MNSVMRLCPRCRTVSYFSSMTWSSVCPRCSFDLGMWMERRDSPRLPGQHQIVLGYQDTKRLGLLLDYSDRGMRIAHRGHPLIPQRVLAVEARNLDIDGSVEVRWVKMIEDNLFHAGIRLL